MRVWKYWVPVTDDIKQFAMPEGANVLSLQVQRGDPCLWVQVDPRSPSRQRHFKWVGTGHNYDGDRVVAFVGTVQVDRLVFHLFEVKP